MAERTTWRENLVQYHIAKIGELDTQGPIAAAAPALIDPAYVNRLATERQAHVEAAKRWMR